MVEVFITNTHDMFCSISIIVIMQRRRHAHRRVGVDTSIILTAGTGTY